MTKSQIIIAGIAALFLFAVLFVWACYYLSREMKWFRCHECNKIWNENGETLPDYVIPFPQAETAICSACARAKIKEMEKYAKHN